jgi:hypothetical protein
MHDLPSVPALLALARDVLVGELTPLLPEDRRNDALLVAECMAIAERRAELGEKETQVIHRELELFYEGSRPVPPPPQPSPACGGGKTSKPSPACGGGKGGGYGGEVLLCRFADDLRSGAFEASPRRDRAARAILWRVTIDRLRQSNPNFLAANGFD